MWTRKKDNNKDAYITNKMYNINEFIFDEKVQRKARQLLKTYRDEFKPKLLKKDSTSDRGMLLATVPLIEELKYYYNNDLCIAVTTSIAIARVTNFNLRTHAYYAENALFRICNTWEYLSIILSHFLGINLIVGHDLRNKIIEAKCHNINFIKQGNGYKSVITRLPDKVVEEIKPSIKKEYKLFNISTKAKNNTFHKSFKKKYTPNDNIQALFDLYYSENVKEIVELRNEIVHGRALGAKFSVGPIDFMPAQGININPRGWYSFKDLDGKLEKNLSALRTAIQMLVNIIFTNDVPNQKHNGDKSFYVYKIKCNNCSKELMINDLTVDVFKKNEQSLICPYCKGEDTSVQEKVEVHDRYYDSNIYEYNKFVFDYWENEETNC